MDRRSEKKMTRKKRTRQSENAVAKKYVPPECSLCVTRRIAAGKGEARFAEVTHTVRENGFVMRRLRCRFCDNRWKHVQKTPSA